MSPHGLYWDARAHLKKSNAVARDLFIFVAFIYGHPVEIRQQQRSDGRNLAPKRPFTKNLTDPGGKHAALHLPLTQKQRSPADGKI